MFSSNSSILNVIQNFNLTEEEILAFLRKMQELNSSSVPSSLSSMPYCDEFCNGRIRETLLNYKNLHGYIAIVICLFGTIANIFNIIVLTRKDMGKTPINTILKWLAVADMFVLIEYIPFATYMYLIFPDCRDFKYSWAVYLTFHMHFTQIFHTISISLTVTLAVWRYVAIKHPHGSFAIFIMGHCGEAILISFIISPVLCFPTFFVFEINEKIITDNNTEIILYHLDADEDTFLYSFNFWVHSIIIKLLPCVILTVISFILIHVLYQAAKRRVKLKGYKEKQLMKKQQDQQQQLDHSTTTNVLLLQNGHKYDQQYVHSGGGGGGSRSAKTTDRRTDRTTMLLVAVLLLFLITEFPQGILGLLSGILEKCFFTHCYALFGEIMDLLALINAAVGFLLYGLMSKQFRSSFKSVFFPRKYQRNEMTKVTGLNTTCV